MSSTITNEAFSWRDSCKFAGDNLCKLQSLPLAVKKPMAYPKAC